MLNFNRHLFNELIVRGHDVYVRFNPDADGVDIPVHANCLSFGSNTKCEALNSLNDGIYARLFFDGVQAFVKIPWSSVVKVGLQSGDEWQVVAEPRSASKDWQ